MLDMFLNPWERVRSMVVFDGDAGGGGGAGVETVVAPGTPAAFVHGAADGASGGTVTLVDPPDPALAPTNGSPTFSVADIEKARREERDKLYPQIETLQKDLGQLRSAAEQREQAEQAARDEAERVAREAHEAELSARELLEERDRTWSQRFEVLEEENRATRELLRREQAFAQLQEYRSKAISAASDDIMPELLDMVSGATPEEVDASIEALKQRTNSILANMQGAVAQQRQQMIGTTATAPSVGPMDNATGQRTFSAAEIANMSEQDYARYRTQLLGAAGQAARGAG